MLLVHIRTIFMRRSYEHPKHVYMEDGKNYLSINQTYFKYAPSLFFLYSYQVFVLSLARLIKLILSVGLKSEKKFLMYL